MAGVTKTELATDIAALAVAGLAIAANPGIVTSLGTVPPLLSFGSKILSRFSNNPQHITTRAVEHVLRDMRQSPEITASLLGDTRQALAAIQAPTQLTGERLAGTVKNGQVLEADLVALLMAQIPQGANPKARGLIETALSAGVRACTATDEFRTALNYELIQELARDMAQVKDNSAVTRDMAAQLLAGLEGVQRPELNMLAHRFGHPDPEGAGLTEFKGFLLQKAEDLRRYQAQIDAIDDRVAGLGNLKAAAKDAADRLDFAEVEMLLARVDQVETEIAAQTKELRADNALLQGKVEAAFAHLSAAADSFQGLDPLDPARRRADYCERLYNHGLRYGGAGLALAAKMLRAALSNLSQTDHPQLWAHAQNSLGVTLREQGNRAAGPEGARLLAKAVTACNAALRVYTEDAHPLLWAKTQINLGAALRTRGEHTAGPEGAALLAEAVTAYNAALRVTTEDAYPPAWATTQNNLGVALQAQGTLTAGPEGAGLLAEASAAYNAALRVRTEHANPPGWAMTQENIALAEVAQAQHDSCADPLPHWRAALAAVNNALRVFDPEHTSFDHAKASKLRDDLLAELRDLGEDI